MYMNGHIPIKVVAFIVGWVNQRFGTVLCDADLRKVNE